MMKKIHPNYKWRVHIYEFHFNDNDSWVDLNGTTLDFINCCCHILNNFKLEFNPFLNGEGWKVSF